MKRWLIPSILLLAVAASSQVGPAEDAEETAPEVTPVTDLLPAQSYTLRQGEALFHHYCATCHGERGRGDGFNAYNLDPKPRDLTEPEFQAQRSDEDLASIVRTGGGAVGLSNAMPPWGRTLSSRQIDQLVVYMRALETEPEESP